MIKDANELMQHWLAEGVSREEMGERFRQMLKAAPTAVELCCAWAGEKEGAERDQAMRVAFNLVGELDKLTRAQYRTRLARNLNISIREFNDLAKAVEKAGGGKGELEVVEIYGGVYCGHLVEYMYDPEAGEARLAWRDEQGKIGTGEELMIEGTRYVPKSPGPFVRDGGILFASELGALKSTRELVGIIESFITQHYLLENRYLSKIMAYYVLMTWIYDSFNALPYLRAMGEPGAGKSELMRRVGHICYRFMQASGANTAASFFRATEMYRGTVFIDEADLYDGGDMSNDIVKFLNQGAMKGNPIWRLEETIDVQGKKTYDVATFNTFCPKLIAMRKDFRDDAVASRALTIRLLPREPIELKSRGIRLYIDEEFRQQAQAIRNLLLRWRLQHWEAEIQVGEELMDLEISSRLNQVTMPLKALARDDVELQEEIEQFLRAYNREMVLTRSMTLAARIVEAMWIMWNDDERRHLFVKEDEGGVYMMIGDVRTVANKIIDEMNKEDGDDGQSEEQQQQSMKRRKRDNLSARGVGHIIRNELQLQVGTRKGAGYPVYWDELKMTALGKRYGIVMEKPKPGKNGKHAEGKQDEIPF